MGKRRRSLLNSPTDRALSTSADLTEDGEFEDDAGDADDLDATLDTGAQDEGDAFDAPVRPPAVDPPVEQPVEAPDGARDIALAAKSPDPEVDAASAFTKDVATGNPAAPRTSSPGEVFPKEFAEEEDDDWFLRTGQPAPPREVDSTEGLEGAAEGIDDDEDSVLATRPSPVPAVASPYLLVLGGLGVLGVVVVLVLLVMLFS